MSNWRNEVIRKNAYFWDVEGIFLLVLNSLVKLVDRFNFLKYWLCIFYLDAHYHSDLGTSF